MAGKLFSLRNVALLALSLSAASAYAVDVTVAYQTSAEPAKVAQAENSFAKRSGATVDWRKFDSGSSVLRALASGDVQIGNIGSSPLAVAASQKLPIEVFLIASQLGSSEALVVKNDIKSPQDLIGKRIAVPFISTTHYSLLASLKHWGIKPEQVKILNLQPPAIAAAWQRGDIDGAYVWAPVVNELAKQGKVLTDSAQVGEWGSPTLDVWVVRKDFAEKHPDVVTAFAASALQAQKAWPGGAGAVAERSEPSQHAGAPERRAGSAGAGAGEGKPLSAGGGSGCPTRPAGGQGDPRYRRIPQAAGQDPAGRQRLQRLRDRPFCETGAGCAAVVRKQDAKRQSSFSRVSGAARAA